MRTYWTKFCKGNPSSPDQFQWKHLQIPSHHLSRESRVTSVHQELHQGPHHIGLHHLLQQLLLLLLLLHGVVLHLAGAGVVVVKELGQGGEHWDCLHGWVDRLEERVGRAVLRVAVVGGAAKLQLYHGAHVVGVQTEEQLRELLELGVWERSALAPALEIIVRTAVAVLGTLRVTLTSQAWVVPGRALPFTGLGALGPVVWAAVGVVVTGGVTLTRGAAVVRV